MTEYLFYAYVTAIGFCAAGLAASASQLVTGQPLRFGIDTTATTTAIPGVFTRVLAGPAIVMRNAVKAACRSDFKAQCSGVTPGGAAALSCLQQHNASLSAPCQQAVGAIGGAAPAGSTATAAPAAPAPAIPMRAFSPREEIFIVRQSCGMDFRSYCSAVPLGGGRGM